MKTTAKGFTLIELIVVITIIAILAATALPRFINVQGDARVAKTNAIFGSMRSAAALAKSRCELDLAQRVSGSATACNTSTVGAGKVNMDGVNVDMLLGYPTAHADGILTAAQVSLSADGVAATNPGGTGLGATLILDAVGATTLGQCTITYLPASLSGTTIVAPNISVVTTGC